MRVCDFIIFEIPILTVEMIYVVDHTLSYCQNRDLKYNKITNSYYLHLVYSGGSRGGHMGHVPPPFLNSLSQSYNLDSKLVSQLTI